MLPKLCPYLCPNTICLSEPLAQAENSLVDIVLKFHRIVKGALGIEGILTRLRQGSAFEEPLEWASRFVVDFDFF
jgi:hypothetical protein